MNCRLPSLGAEPANSGNFCKSSTVPQVNLWQQDNRSVPKQPLSLISLVFRAVSGASRYVEFEDTDRSRTGYDFAPRTLSRIDPAIRARVGIAIDEDSAGVLGTIGLASVNRVRA